MPKPLSLDLRERAVGAVEGEGLSCRQAAARFGVGVSSVIRWVQRYREMGSAAPAKVGGHRPRKIVEGYRDWLIKRCRKDFTVRGLVAELAGCGLDVDYRTVWVFVHAETLSHTKRR
jgi:putative transposase